MRRLFKLALVMIVALFCFNTAVLAQYTTYNHPELKWHSIHTEKFSVHYHEGAERTARTTLTIAEMVYEPITKLYDYRPDGKIHFVIRDHDDYSNGATYYYENKIEIWAKPLDFEFRGTHHWLYDVVTHEFTHLIQLGAARKGPRWLPAFYFQYLDYEREKRPDVLYGFPNRLISYPKSMTVVPMWFAEGTAQFMTDDIHHDWWDSHRDMMIRTRSLEGKLLTMNEMGVFGKSSHGSESVYNHGYALVRYISDRWGENAVKQLSNELGKPISVSFNAASKKILGITELQLYKEWTRDIGDDYLTQTETIRANRVSGEIIFDKGFGNLYPQFSPDGKTLAFLSNEGQDYLSLASLRLYDLENEEVTKPKSTVKGSFSWSPDSKYILFAKLSTPNRHGSKFGDLYLWNVNTEKEVRLTKDARLESPTYSNNGKYIAAVTNRDGTHNLSLITLPDSIDDKDKQLISKVSIRQLSDFINGEQVYRPVFSPNDDYIYFTFANYGTSDIYRYNIEKEEFETVLSEVYDVRDLAFVTENELVFSSDETGIFNLYKLDLNTNDISPISNVIGGAFMATALDDSMIAYSEYSADGYSIRLLRNASTINRELLHYRPIESLERPHLHPVPEVEYNDVGIYKSPFSKLFIVPRITWDYGVFKPGFYAWTSDILENLSLFGGAAMNGKGDRDVYLSTEYKILYPTLYMEVYNIVRHNHEEFDDELVIIGERLVDGNVVPIYGKYGVDYKFGLTELDIGGRIPFKGENTTISAILRLSNYKSVLEFDDGGSFDYTYFKGNSYLLKFDTNYLAPVVGGDIHPVGGWTSSIEYARENNRFLDGFEIVQGKGTIVEVYKPYNYHRFSGNLDYYKKIYKSLVLNPQVNAGWLSKNDVDPFFHLYAGGLLGLRGYSYYSLGGTTSLVGRLALRFPLLTHIDKRLGWMYFDKLHSSIFFESGNAWMGSMDVADFKKDVGAEIRMKMFSWYGFPTAIQFTGAYGLDEFVVSQSNFSQKYGKEWRYYLTILFDYF